MMGMMVVAALCGAGVCNDSEVVLGCKAWDVKMNLKTLAPKKTTCRVVADSLCDDATTDVVYYLDSAARKIKGYLWVCEYECGRDYNVVLWDEKNKVALIPLAYEAVNFDEVYVYGKKATAVAGTIQFAGVGLDGADAIDIVASGLNGKLVRGGTEEDCYIKSLSGYAAGKIAYCKPSSRKVGGSKGGLCDEPEEPVTCDEYCAKILSLCDACCFDGWCDADDAEDMVPAVGTWSMKYNKKVSKGKTPMSKLVPAYAL